MSDTRAHVTAPHYVYRLYGSRGRLLYVGCTMDLDRRIGEHRRRFRPRIARVDIEGPFERPEALRIERAAIESEGPAANLEWTDRYRRGHSPTKRLKGRA